MKIEQLTEVTRALRDAAKPLGFDSLAISTYHSSGLAIRVANNSICRENVSTELSGAHVTGESQSREGTFRAATTNKEELLGRMRVLRGELEGQPPNQEYVRPSVFTGQCVWTPCAQSLEEVFSPERLYPIIETNLKKCRQRGLRASGFLEAREVRDVTCFVNGSEVATRDMGLSVKFAVDNPKSSASGVGKASVLGCAAGSLESEIARAMDDAIKVCEQSENPRELPPGDYTVILTPGALRELIQTLMWYGFFDKREIDEGRTYLSGKHSEIRFPDGVRLTVGGSIEVAPGVKYASLPLNNRFVPCSPVQLIGDGKIGDFFYPEFWSQKLGRSENLRGPGDVAILEFGGEGGGVAKSFGSIDELVQNTERAIFVNDFWYLRMVAPMDGVITGMTRDGLLEVRDGKIVGAVRNMRWHDNPLRVLTALSGITRSRSLLGLAALADGGGLSMLPAVRAETFHFSSVTKF